MSKKLTQKDLLVLHLAEVKDWVPAYALKGFKTSLGWLGSEADRRAYEVMQLVAQQGFYEIKGICYMVEERRNGKYKEYRIASQATKPIIRYEPVYHEGHWVAKRVF